MPIYAIDNKLSGALRRVLDSVPLHVVALVALLATAPVFEALRVSAFSNRDLWWHLRSGLWILQSHSVPRSGLFSQYADRPWVASSWAFEALMAAAYKLLGLRAVPILLMAFKLALAVVTFCLARGYRGFFWGAIGLSAIAQYVIVDLQPLPNFSSILFFGVELILLLQSRRTADLHSLLWLPLLFLLWANFDSQFLNGLLLLGLYLLAESAEFLLHRFGVGGISPPAHSLPKIAALAGLSIIATCLTPYSFQLFPSVFQIAYGRLEFEYFEEMRAFAFRQPEHFVLLLLVMTAFLVLGRQRSRDLFKLGVMAAGAMLAFRVQRDVWCVALPAIAVIGDALADYVPEATPPRGSHRKWEKSLAAMLTLVVFLVASLRVPNSETLMTQVSRVLPVKACDYIRANQLPPPLYNAYAWGGFLIWYLPEYPVAIDGRVNLYGNEINRRHLQAAEGKQRLETDPGFLSARTILLERGSGMTEALTTLPALRAQFRVVYQDDIATILVRQ
jgi:hypothetical protein